jgi:probable HAF family extracellular repeat protein
MDEFTVECSAHRRREHGLAGCWALARQCMLGISLILACQSAMGQAMYRIKPLGSLGDCGRASGFNAADEVTGEECNAHGDAHAFLWKNDGNPVVDLGPPEVPSYSEGDALNASGLVAGDAQDGTGQFAFLSSGNGTPMTRIYDRLGGSKIYPSGFPSPMNDLGQLTGYAYIAGDSVYHAFLWKNDGSPLLDLGTLGGDFSNGAAINAAGQVAGRAQRPGNTVSHAVVWTNNGTKIQDLGTLSGGGSSYSCCINASGQVAGVSHVRTTKPQTRRNHAFFWRNDGTPMQDLGTLGGAESFAYAFNDAGQVAGSANTKNGAVHAFVWMNDGTAMRDLGSFGGTSSSAIDINFSGQVTGNATLAGNAVSHAFLWRNDGTKIQDLNKLIDPTDPLKPYVTLTHGDFINDFGDIVADGTDSRTEVSAPYLLQGTVLTLNPRSLAFDSQPINTKSAAKSVTMTNTSAKVVAITSITLKGTAAGQFASTNNCGSSLVGHATCTIGVTFTPTAKGAKSATLNVNGGGGGLRSVSLTGTGT